MTCPKCGSELIVFDTTIYMWNKKTKKADPAIEPWLLCTKALTDLADERRRKKCRFAVKESEFGM